MWKSGDPDSPRISRRDAERILRENSRQVWNKNQLALRFYSLLSCAISLAAVITCLLLASWRPMLISYAVIGAASAAAALLAFFLIPKKQNALLPVLYGLFALMLLSATHHTIRFFSLDATQLLFIVMLLILPMGVLDRGARTGGFTVLMAAIFIVLSFIFLPRGVAVDYSVNTAIMCAVSLAVSTLVRRSSLNGMESRRQLMLQRDCDSLTGLPNRRKLFTTFGLLESSESATPFAIIMVDVDGFKDYNDAYGHQSGDSCLRSLGRCFAEFSRENGIELFRFGGEEFLGLCLNCGYERAGELAGELCRAVAALGLPYYTSEPGIVTVSAGYADSARCNIRGFERVTAAADAALYKAKGAGKNRAVGALDAADGIELDDLPAAGIRARL